MTQDTQREAFEAWSNAKKSRKEGYDAFDIWQAAIEHDRKGRGEPVPKGWKLVPETPTSKQIVHMACQIKGADADGWFRTDGDDWPEHVDAAERAYKWALSEAPQPAEPVNKTDWNTVLSSWSDDDFVRVFHERPDLADRLRKMLSEPVKHKRQYAQGTALGEFGIIPMCDQVDDEPGKVPSDDLAHEIWAAAQTTPGEGIEDAVERVAALLARYGNAARPDNCDAVNIAIFGE